MKALLKSLAVLGLLGLTAGTGQASEAAASYPTRPLQIVVPYPPGGSADVLARTLGDYLGRALKQSVVVSNKPGAGTAIGARAVAQSPADGYTLMIGTVSSHAMNPALARNIGYDPVKDFTAVAPLATIPFVLLAHPKLELRSMAELIDLARKQPGKINFSSAGNGTSNHLAGEMLNTAAKLRLVHIPYKGSAPALNALLGGEVELMFDLIVTAAPQVKAGRANALVITTKRRSPLLPEVPTVDEVGLPALELSAWFGLFAPSGLPGDLKEILARETTRIVASADFQERMRSLGAMSMDVTAAQFPGYVAAERDRWAQVIKASGIEPE